MEPKRYDPSVIAMLGMDTDPFRNGNDCCSIVHTETGRYRHALNEIRDYGTVMEEKDFIAELKTLGECYRNILAEGYRMCEITAKIYVLGMVG